MYEHTILAKFPPWIFLETYEFFDLNFFRGIFEEWNRCLRRSIHLLQSTGERTTGHGSREAKFFVKHYRQIGLKIFWREKHSSAQEIIFERLNSFLYWSWVYSYNLAVLYPGHARSEVEVVRSRHHWTANFKPLSNFDFRSEMLVVFSSQNILEHSYIDGQSAKPSYLCLRRCRLLVMLNFLFEKLVIVSSWKLPCFFIMGNSVKISRYTVGVFLSGKLK